MQIIYFDNNATTKLDKRVLEKMNEAFELPMNAAAVHNMGRTGSGLVEAARNEVRNLVNGNNYEVIFTGSATEATNTIFCGIDVEYIVCSEIDHAATYNCNPKNKKKITIDVLENGKIDLKSLEKTILALKSEKFLVSLMLANSECGSIQPLSEAAKLVHQNGGLIHGDIVQAAGKIDVDLEKLNLDFATISAHKINGPQGVGALLYRKGLNIDPLIYGGSQEQYKRAGTTNVAGIVGLGEACKLAKEKPKKYEKVQELRDYLEEELKNIAGRDLKIFCEGVERLPNTSYISVAYLDSQAQVINFDLNGICVSGGSACSSGSTKASRVLKAMHATPDFLGGAVRVSLGIENTKEEIDKFIKVWDEFYQKNKI